MGVQRDREKGSDTKSRNGPSGASHFWCLTPFPDYQIGPRQYLFLRKLHKVRRDLIVADPDETTVAAVLARCGVWELGRFSGRYRSQFGERPSETLSRRSRNGLAIFRDGVH
jgi:hypothetical protein